MAEGRILERNVTVTNPDTRETVTLPAGSVLPPWAEPLVTNPLAFTSPDADEPEAPLPYAPLSDESIDQMAARMTNDDLKRLQAAIEANEAQRAEAERSAEEQRAATEAAQAEALAAATPTPDTASEGDTAGSGEATESTSGTRRTRNSGG